MKKIFFLLLCLISLTSAAQQPPYKNSSLPVDARVEDLLSRMTPEEKFWQLYMIPGDLSDGKDRYKNGIFGFQVAASAEGKSAQTQGLQYHPGAPAKEAAEQMNAIQKYFVEETRLGIPVIFFDEALHGLIREGATAFPQSIALAASWDTTLMHQVAQAIALECRSRGIRHILSPVLNIARDVRWGRTEETYGEDPCLTSLMAYAYISELQKAGIIATPKHFAVNVGDGGRDSYPIDLDQRILEELYFPAFKMAIQQGKAGSVMAAYNSLDGIPCSANDWLLNQKLRKDWGFKGFVVSDAGGTGGANVLHFTAADYAEATRNALNGGLDVIFQTSYDHYPLFWKAFERGMIDTNVINNAVRRVLRAKFELGLFEHPYADITAAEQNNNNAEHRKTALQAAQESIVLLKNENNFLPLNKNIRTLAVIGPEAATANLGGYSGPGSANVSVLEGLQKIMGDHTRIIYAEGCGHKASDFVVTDSSVLFTDATPVAAHGLQATYFANITLEGKPAVTRIEKQLNGQWTLFSPDPSLPYDWYSARWTGVLKVPVSGTYRIGLEGNEGYRLYLNDTLLIDRWVKGSYRTTVIDHYFEQGRPCSIRIEYFESSGNARLKLIWDEGKKDRVGEQIGKSLSVAAQADAVVVVAGIDEGEFRDRAILDLPGRQGELIKALAATGRPVVVILNAGSAVDITPWEEDATAILDMWYAGCEGGTAVAQVLCGAVNPSGRLPFTWPMDEGQLPLVYNHKPTGRGDDYVNLTGMPRYPFGYGLSYTTFEYSALNISPNTLKPGDSASLSFTLKNTGTRDGAEVVQIYFHDEFASVARPVKELKAFRRVFLKAGESATITFTLTPEIFMMPDKDLNMVIEPGDFRVMVGSSAGAIRLRSRVGFQISE